MYVTSFHFVLFARDCVEQCSLLLFTMYVLISNAVTTLLPCAMAVNDVNCVCCHNPSVSELELNDK
jgi:hypothetical protein